MKTITVCHTGFITAKLVKCNGTSNGPLVKVMIKSMGNHTFSCYYLTLCEDLSVVVE